MIRAQLKVILDKLGYLWGNYRNHVIISLAAMFVVMTVYVTSQMANTLKEKEIHEMELWVHTMQQLSRDVAMPGVQMEINSMTSTRQNIPFVVLDDNMRVVASHLVETSILNHPDRLRRQVSDFSSLNRPIVFQQLWSEERYLLFYGSSELLQRLYFVPITQFAITIIFFLLTFAVLRSSRQGEQDRIWVGLAKETAHQLGTPISSLMGWIEYLKDQDGVDRDTIAEMGRDLTQLMKVTDRFSKIGSDTPLTPMNVNEVVGSVVSYFRNRVPRGVKISYDGLSMAPSSAMLNETLIEWVVENLMKNALDALAGSGQIIVKILTSENYINIDVSDTGRGIPKSSWRKIFDPGYTTKTRGWGLGLSLSRRIVEDYHNGHISVTESQVGVGTTMRITLKRIFD